MRLVAFVVGSVVAFGVGLLLETFLDSYRAAEARREIELLERMVDRA